MGIKKGQHIERNDRFIVVMVCHHKVSFAIKPDKRDMVFCVRCDDWRTIVDIYGQYRLICRTCHYGASFPGLLLTAKRAARKHANAYPCHVVQVLEGDSMVMMFRTDPPKLFDSTVIPY